MKRERNTLSHLSNCILALLATTDREIYIEEIATKFSVSKEEALLHIYELKEYLSHSSLDISITNQSVMLVIKPEYAKEIPQEYKKHKQLSTQAFEVLAVICLKQPCTKQEIDQARGGIDSEKVLQSLCDAGLVKKICSLNSQGSPVLYSLTEQQNSVFTCVDLRAMRKWLSF